jgi:hypothetical protein
VRGARPRWLPSKSGSVSTKFIDWKLRRLYSAISVVATSESPRSTLSNWGC